MGVRFALATCPPYAKMDNAPALDWRGEAEPGKPTERAPWLSGHQSRESTVGIVGVEDYRLSRDGCLFRRGTRPLAAHRDARRRL